MKKICDYLSPDQIEEMKDFSISEKLAATLKFINYIDPDARFSCKDVSLFLGINPQGLHSISRAIRKIDQGFPIEMILKVNRNSSAKIREFNREKVNSLSESWKSN